MKASEAFELAQKNDEKALEENQRIKTIILTGVRERAEQGQLDYHFYRIRVPPSVQAELEADGYVFKTIQSGYEPYCCIAW